MRETRNEKFKRLAEKRTNQIIYKVQVLGNLANKSNYEYSDEDINKMFGAIETTLRLVKVKFKSYSKKIEGIRL